MSQPNTTERVIQALADFGITLDRSREEYLAAIIKEPPPQGNKSCAGDCVVHWKPGWPR